MSSSSTTLTAPTSTPSIAVAELDSSPNASPVAASSASSSTSSTAVASTGSGTGTDGSSGATASSSITPNGIKAGVAGFPDIVNTNKAALDQYAPYISWYSDYWPNTTDFTSGTKTVKGIGMLWGNGDLNETDPTAPIGTAAADDKNRYAAYTDLPASPAPDYMMGFYEPDWPAPYSSNMNAPTAATAWKATLGKLGNTLVGSPSMATQMDETWLTPFMEALGVTEPPWDYTCIHTNKNTSDGVKADVGYYWTKYGKPVWVSEFACVNDKSWTMCDQDTVNTFIPEVVDFFEKNASVIAYGYSNGAGLGSVWPLINSTTGKLTSSGNCYLDVLQGKVSSGQACTN
ncbi:hypothetical protein HO173_000596 [Letharia columbiana]|uniref:Asl1-like glycosyl hydrolase catalytic domain-containing protein n=1 Tax=Letharia columbiana TaxID=112416 RepID=A0A8H6G7Z6_9LECA|nr:uncharacterized protein HO173_000596 [Letharia columbiana]KAF6241884.1 hypothetical protein HO173_000596 [Letharia columbiana]